MTIFAETERLILRTMEEVDIDGMYELDKDPEVHRYLGGSTIQTRAEARAIIQFVRQQYQSNGIGRWSVIEKSSGEFIGWSGFKLIKEPINQRCNFYDFGYRFIRRSWGKGYASESAQAALQYGFEKMALTEINAIADSEHLVSNHILTKQGFEFVNAFNYETVVHNFYALSQMRWQELKPAAI